MIKYLKETKLFGEIARFNVFNPINLSLFSLKNTLVSNSNKVSYLILTTCLLITFQNTNGQSTPIFPNSQVLKQGIDKRPGAKYLIQDVQLKANGSLYDVDAILSIVSFIGTPTIVSIDDTQFVKNRFEPVITYSQPNQAVRWRIEFIAAGSADSNINDAVVFPLDSYTLEIIDLDAGEWAEVIVPDSYQLASPTIISATPGTSVANSTRFTSETNTTDQSVSIDNTRSIVRINYTNVSVVDFTLGRNNNVPNITRNISVGFLGEVVFTRPVVVEVNEPPVVINNLNNIIISNTTFTKNVLNGSSDPDGNLAPETITLIDPNDLTNLGSVGKPLVIPGVGTYTVNKNGKVIYTPATDYVGDASILFRVADTLGANSNDGKLQITVSADTDNDGIANIIDLDDDNDGILDTVENGNNFADGDEDGDGIPNYLDTEDNGNSGDGSTTNYTDANNDGIPDVYDADGDGIPNHLDLDSDNDGIPDIVEAGGVDTDGNGLVDNINTNGTLKNDVDKDGLDDRYDANVKGGTNGVAITNPDTDNDGIVDTQDLDADNDGIPDIIEAGGTDTDGNGLVDTINANGKLKNDIDSDGFDDLVDGDVGQSGTSNNKNNALIITGSDTDKDGKPNSYATGDTDGNGIPNHLDLDSDNDGIVDIIEAGGKDANKDGKVDNIDTNGKLTTDRNTNGFDDAVDGAINSGTPLIITGTDTNNNGKPNSYKTGDADNDGKLNHLDIDADNDGIPDNIEGQTTADYIAPSGIGTTIKDTNNNGVDDNYEDISNNIVGLTPENTDKTDEADYLDSDSDNDGIPDIFENGHTKNILSGNDKDNDGLDDNFEDNDDSSINGATVNDGLNPDNKVTDLVTLENSFGDEDNDFDPKTPTTGNLDYRDVPVAADVMITQVYQFNNEKWIEITNISSKVIPAKTIKIQLYKDKTGDQTGVEADASYIVGTELKAGKSVLFKNSTNSIISKDELAADATIIINNALTSLDDATNDIITLSSVSGVYSWAYRYDVASNIANKTSVVRIDETLKTNPNYTKSEWVVFIDDAINSYQSGYGGGNSNTKRHSQDPLISEIKTSNKQANTLLGLHRIKETTTNTDGTWNNGFPDRSRYVIVNAYYNHENNRLSARKLKVVKNNELRVTDQLLVVTNDIELNGEIRLSGSSAQLIQTHTDASTVSGDGRLFVDQNSEVPSLYRYNYMSSPVTTLNEDTYTIESVLRDGTIANTPKEIKFVGGYDGAFTGSGISLADYWVYTYAPASNGRANWAHKYKKGIIDRGDGYTFKGPGRNQNYTFVGTPNDGKFETKNITKGQSYLIGNPFPSALNARKFLDDNNALISTIYFWQHVAETEASGTAGHNFGGYIGGYAAQNVSMATAVKTGKIEPVNYTLEAEDSPTLIGAILDLIGLGNKEVSLAKDEYITFENITRGVDSLRIVYRATGLKKLKIKINNVERGEFKLPNTSNRFEEIKFAMCITSGSDITLTSNSNSSERLYIDKIILKDEDGQLACIPDSGGDTYTNLYKTPEPYVAIGQGFFVEGIGNGKIKFNNSQREYKTEGDGTSIFLKSSQKKTVKSVNNELPILKLGMSYSNDQGSNLHRQIGISFNQANSFSYEKGYDSEMFDVSTTDFYWKFPNDANSYVISGVQEISNALEVPLEVIVSENSIITINIDEINNINQDVYIKDKLTGKTQQINNANVTYQLKAGTYTDRFVLAFNATEETLLGVQEDILAGKTSIYADNDNNNIVISKNQEVNIQNVELFNILGKKVSTWNIKEQKSTYQLNIKKQLTTGIYIVKMNTDKGTISKKLVIE
ncbi:T9SS type A sorting domain-containing protein [Polaribacter sp. 11A2H]|uniref:T9SS type A sorting domain-containing protein n=1 Tax=Polaribacter sp. 11A2H TaxID=2687290 RepID=UPI001407DCC5|nr:T9SS type A sorting domain-containing protein [Polaribacter sp. 11A2H]